MTLKSTRDLFKKIEFPVLSCQPRESAGDGRAATFGLDLSDDVTDSLDLQQETRLSSGDQPAVYVIVSLIMYV